MQFPLELILFLFLLVVGAAVIHMRNLFAAAMLTGIFSLLSCGLFTLMDAVDVAFTEAAVGAGMSTILILATLALTPKEERPARPGARRPWLALAVCLMTGAVLVYGTLDMPAYGDRAAVIHHHVVPRYVVDSMQEIGLPNFVTSILASYRGYDTFGELSVIFTAGIGVMLILGHARRGDGGAT